MFKKALTLVEVLISMLIFALVMGGLANLFVATKRLTLYTHSRMMLVELGRYFLDPLQMDVRQDEWDEVNNDYISSNPLHKRINESESDISLDGIDYTPTYTVGVPPGFAEDDPMRKVKLTVSYPASTYE